MVSGVQIAPPIEEEINFNLGKILEFRSKKNLNDFLKIHKSLLWEAI